LDKLILLREKSIPRFKEGSENLTYPRDYRQERTYGFSAVGVIIAIVGIIAIMFVVVILSGFVFFFPFGGSYEFESSPELETILPSIVLYSILIAALTLVVIVGSWIYSRGRLASESQ
jgi:hypothetical protein